MTIKKLAESIVSIEKSSTKIKPTLEANNLIQNIKSFPENIYVNTLKKNFNEQIKQRYDEIKQTCSI